MAPSSAEEVAARLRLDPRSTALFLRACAGLGLVEEKSGRFENSAVAAAFLVTRSPAFMGNVIRYSDQLYGTWGKLEDALRSGRPALPAETYLGDDPARTRNFVQAMHERALGIARALVGILDLQRPPRDARRRWRTGDLLGAPHRAVPRPALRGARVARRRRGGARARRGRRGERPRDPARRRLPQRAISARARTSC